MLFFDTNILVYSVDAAETARRPQAQEVLAEAIRDGSLTLSTQVLQEFYNTVLRRRLMSPAAAVDMMRLWVGYEVVNSTADLLFRAFALQQELRLSVWDALIVQAALDAGCSTLYTEDLQHGQRIGELEIVNPFLAPPAVHEPRRAYGKAAARKRKS
jgi:predicted nucleic acid-binding protein